MSNSKSAWVYFKPLVCDFIGVDVYKTRPHDTWEKLAVDSLDYIELVMMVEEEFDVELTEQELDNNFTIGGLHGLLIRSLSRREVPITHRDTINTRCSHCGRG